MPVVGTAGHVDHGKSTLVHALCGRDPDRWKEEKDRGLTIDLGFAWTRLGGVEVSFVDVPGHERYSKNMLAGIEAIDVALLVVAADEGWMPQSEEHLAVLDLLDVTRGVVALTKVDRVDAELADLAELEIDEKLTGTSLQDTPVVRVASTRGEGLDQLRDALVTALDGVGDGDRGRPRLWVDRSFSVTGAGTVVTGTLLGGSIELDQRLVVLPGGREGRVRGIQSHEQDHARLAPGRRAAVNLAGIDSDAVPRGSMLGAAGDWRETTRFAAAVRTARYVSELPTRGAYHLHVGSGAIPARVRQIDGDTAVIGIDRPLPLAAGDRFILRDTGRRLVVAGGQVLDPAPPRSRRLRPAIPSLRDALDADADARATALLRLRERETLANLSTDSGGGRPAAAVFAGKWALTAEAARDLAGRLTDLVKTFHSDNPLRPGIPSAEASSRLGVAPEILAVLVAREESLATDGAVIRSKSFAGTRSADQEASWKSARETLASTGPSAAPRSVELGLGPELLHALIRDGDLVRVSEDFVYLPEQIESLVAMLGDMESPFTVSDFKDRSGLSRKYAVPFLEWADRNGLTVRQGDTRRLR